MIVFDGKVHFYHHHDVLITPHIGPHISHTIDIVDESAIQEVVKSFSQFYHHLRLTREVTLTQVRMELKLLKERNYDFGSSLTPIGENLIANEPVTIVVDKHALLGMMIINETEHFLYPYLFYFDPMDLTISMFIFHQLITSPNSL